MNRKGKIKYVPQHYRAATTFFVERHIGLREALLSKTVLLSFYSEFEYIEFLETKEFETISWLRKEKMFII